MRMQACKPIRKGGAESFLDERQGCSNAPDSVRQVKKERLLPPPVCGDRDIGKRRL